MTREHAQRLRSSHCRCKLKLANCPTCKTGSFSKAGERRLAEWKKK